MLLEQQTNIYVIGYFGHSNTGDQQYILTFDYFFKTFLPNPVNFNINYLDCDHIKTQTFLDSDIIILGGGDVLNNYFLDQLISKFINKPNKILAVSVGLPYTDIIINTNKLNIIDYIFVRSQQDISLFQQYFHPHRIFYLPDLSYFMLNLLTPTQTIHTQLVPCQITSETVEIYKNSSLINKHLSTIRQNGKKIIALTLSRHIYHPDYKQEYYNILNSFSKFVKYLLTFDYHVVLLPFNTNESCPKENDILIHNDLMKFITDNPKILLNITNITTHLEPLEILDLYQYFYLTIPMRFHAVLFSMYTKTPMLPIFTTRKIKNLLLDITWHHGYELECNSSDIPMCLDELIIINRFRTLVEIQEHLEQRLETTNRDINFDNIKQLTDLITCDYSKIIFSLDTNIIDTRVQNIYNKLQEFAKTRNLDDFRNAKDSNLQKLITQMVSYYLTNGTLDSTYNYGLSTKMFTGTTYNYKDEWSWVIRDNNKKYLDKSKRILNNPYGLFNINYIDQVDYSGAHRSGWQFVYENIKYLHNDSSDLYLDLYLDRTFHWNKDINKELGLIPYKKKWIGFVHHTFDTSFSEYNNYNLLNNPDFIESLQFCKGIFVLSKTLQLKFLEEFNKQKIFVPIYDLVHPTEIHVPQFTWKKFLNNKDKKLVHVGGWLRNVFSFYNLSISSQYKFNHNSSSICDTFVNKRITETIRKVALKGAYMNNYYPTADLPNKLQSFLSKLDTQPQPEPDSCKNTSQNISQGCSTNICQNNCQNSCQNSSQNSQELHNNWYKHFYEYTKYMCDSIDFIDKLSNDDYDELLTENIVFINLVDASAVNTIIECTVRNTPIIINKHPAVVELLGPNYPLYFSNSYSNYFEMNKEICELLSDTNNIKKAYQYLCKQDKSRFNINNFKTSFINYIEHQKNS